MPIERRGEVELNEAQEYVTSRISSHPLTDDDLEQIRNVVRRGYDRFNSADHPDESFEQALDELVQKMDEDLTLTESPDVFEFGPRIDHLLAAICPIWPFC